MSGEDGLIRIKEWVGGSIRGCGRMFRVSESRTSSSWIQKKKKKINKSMLIHVHSEISNMFILKGKSHFSGAVSFWRNLQSQRDRNILPKKKEVRHKFLPGKRSQTQRDYVLPTPFLNFLSPAQTKNESILKFVTNNKKFKIRFRCKRKPKSEIVSLQDIFFDKIYNRMPIMQQSSSDSYQINTH